MTKLKNSITLLDLSPGEKMNITSLELENVMRRRLLDLGFVPGFIVEMIQYSPLGDPLAFRVSGTIIALRKEECVKILGERVG
ncbi:ferrous iron transport protein A [Solibacillus sp. R5-41]|uniref:FeoA family protein n=1 Tax=Solibacillus sp. R5-41 TaxID=2048654 RepID=UPI000C126F2D|nr:ferrous iron transport protein A [Solibacillus sp. R5-41]ATP39554.1 ferrous iron transport protein A [Solibacillus sp. R5-41]